MNFHTIKLKALEYGMVITIKLKALEYGVVVKTMESGARLTEFESWLFYELVMQEI